MYNSEYVIVFKVCVYSIQVWYIYIIHTTLLSFKYSTIVYIIYVYIYIHISITIILFLRIRILTHTIYKHTVKLIMIY